MAEKEYIEREAVMKIIDDYGCTHGGTLGSHSGAVDVVGSAIYKLPAADVVPEKHGHWEYDKHFRFARCSECEAEFYICDLEEISGGNLVKYCPTCGAKMDGGDNNGT
jgi:hypothetical protein